MRKEQKKAYSGKFIPSNPHKYIGDRTNIIYRSSWERKFCQYCDLKAEILKWSSEHLAPGYRLPIPSLSHANRESLQYLRGCLGSPD